MSPITKGAPGYVSRDDPEAIERVYDAVSDTESATTAAEGPEYPTVTDLSAATGFDNVRTLDALAILVDSEVIRSVRRADGAVGFAPADESSGNSDTIKF